MTPEPMQPPPTRPLPDLPDEPIPTPMPADPPCPARAIRPRSDARTRASCAQRRSARSSSALFIDDRPRTLRRLASSYSWA